MRDEIITAADACFRRFGLQRTTMDDIADAAGVSRKTVYNYFENRETLIGEVIGREAKRVCDEARTTLEPSEDPAELIVAAEMALLAAARSSPYVATLLAPDAVGLTGGVVDRSRLVRDVQGAYWRPVLDPLARRGLLRSDDVDELVEWLTFFHFVLVARPSTFDGDDRRTRDMLTRYLVPAILAPTAPARPRPRPRRSSRTSG